MTKTAAKAPQGQAQRAAQRAALRGAREARAEAEAQRDEAEARFHAVFDVNPAPALIVRLRDERVCLANSGLAELSGYAPAETSGASLAELALFADPQQREALLDAPRRWQESQKVEAVLRRKPGDARTVLVSTKPLEYEDQLCCIFTFADITAQKEAEQRFVKIFQLAPMPACLLSPEWRFKDVNESFLALTGHNRLDVVRRTSHALGLWVADEERALLALALAQDGGAREHELRLRTKSGETRVVLAAAEVLDADGSFLLMLHDVTERKQTEEQLHRAIQEVISDTSWFSAQVLERLAQTRVGSAQPPPTLPLSQRERQVLERLARGASNQEIADELGLASQTVRNYIVALYDKIKVRSRAEAVVWARERGIVSLKG